MNDFEPTEKLEQMLGQRSVSLALDTADWHLAEAEKNDPILAEKWRTVKGLLIERKTAEDKAAEDAEAARMADLYAKADACDRDRAKAMADRMVAADGKVKAKKQVKDNIEACTVKDEAGNVIQHDAALEQLWNLVLAAIG